MQSIKNSKHRSQSSEYSITKGRSMCVHCKHVLAWYDLLPVVSWLSLVGKCRYCQKPVHWQYPAVELLTAFLFVLSYIFWPQIFTYDSSFLVYAQFVLWLAILVGLIALIIYDLRWMLLPNRIIFPLYGLAAIYVLLDVAITSNLQPVTSALLGVLVGGGIFYILFQISSGRWIGGGDVKLGFLLGALVGMPLQSMLLLFIASLLGCIIALPMLLLGRANGSTRIPFGPFLIVAGIVVVLFGQSITNWYLDTLMLS